MRVRFLLLLTVLFCVPVYAQVHNFTAYEHLFSKETEREHILYLTDSISRGRGAGTEGGLQAREYIEARFKEYGVDPLGLKYLQGFKVKGVYCYNVIGMVSASKLSERYLVVGAHYDNLGVIKGIVYPGADDNASGVAALLELARAFASYKAAGNYLPVNIIFVAFDAHESSMAGSSAFFETTGIKPYKIDYMINIEQIGSVLAPVHNGVKNYLLVLGGDKVKDWVWDRVEVLNEFCHIDLDVDFTFYGSEQFYNVFYRLGDQINFNRRGVPSLCFTSGITNLTNKPSDTEANINYEALHKRIRYIYNFICTLEL